MRRWVAVLLAIAGMCALSGFVTGVHNGIQAVGLLLLLPVVVQTISDYLNEDSLDEAEE